MTNSLHTLAEIYEYCIHKSWMGKLQLASSQELFLCNDEQLNSFKKNYVYYQSLKIGFGDRVVIKVQPSIKSILAMICLWRLGVTVIPVKSTYSGNALEEIENDSQASATITPDTGEIKYHNNEKNKNTLFKFKRERRVSGSDLALILYSSGSLGAPKGIMLTHNNVISALNSITDYLQIQANDKLLCVSPLSFDYGLYQILMSFKKNCTVIIYDLAIHPILLLKTINKYGVTVFPGVPALTISIERVLHLYPEKIISLKKITNTGGHLPENVVKNLRLKLPHVDIYLMYGLTESKRVLYLPPSYVDEKPGSVGIPMPGLEAKIFKRVYKTDKSLEYIECESNEIGSLFVRGPSVMQGYNKSFPDCGVEIIAGEYRDDNWLSTGDLFFCDEDGFFYFKGREKDLIKQSGYCLYPLEIEKNVLVNKNTALCTVIGEIDEVGNEVAHLFVQLIQDTEVSRKKFINWLELTFGLDYKPKRISFMQNIPLNANGKVDKNKIKLMSKCI